jgi:C4-dicarboxylate-specific signal transduction histidine kinase
MRESDRGLAVAKLVINYTIAAISVGIAVIFTLHLQTFIKHTSSLFFCSVMLSSWYGGLWPGLFAAFLSYIALDYYFIPPLYALGISPEQTPDMIVFVATALFISWLNGNQRRAKQSLRDARDQLDARVRERTAELERTNERLKAEIADREAAEQDLIRARSEIARIARITTVGEFAASIAHELNQPLGSIVTSADACLRWLAAERRNLDEAREAVAAIIRDATRASGVLVRIRGLLRREGSGRECLEINDIIREVIALSESELRRNAISVETELPENLSRVVVDRILLQQVVLNLVLNAVEAMRSVCNRARVLHVRIQEGTSDTITVLVEDSGVGVDVEHSSQIFNAFYTTKAEGIGMGLSISRSIIEAHGGRLCAVAKEGPGSIFCFTLPIEK